MKQNAQMLAKEHEVFRARVKELIAQLYHQNSVNGNGKETSKLLLLDEWEYEGQCFNAITEQGLANIVDEQIDELFSWDDLETETLIEIVHILEDKEFVTSTEL